MDALRELEKGGGNQHAFVQGDARSGDIAWVSSFREKASFRAYNPHITVGHAAAMPEIAPHEFLATRLAVCHLGRFCTCRRILAEWTFST